MSPTLAQYHNRDAPYFLFIHTQGSDHFSREAQHNSTLLINILIRSMLCSKLIADDYRLTENAFDWLIGEIESRFKRAIVSAQNKFRRKIKNAILFSWHRSSQAKWLASSPRKVSASRQRK